MGQKVHPNGFRLGLPVDTESSSGKTRYSAQWCAPRRFFRETLASDLEARSFIEKRLPKNSELSGILIERTGKTVRIILKTAKPGVIIGKKGEEIERFRKELSGKMGASVHINIEEVRKAELDAKLVAKSIAEQLERRVMFRRAMKRAMASSLRAGAKGIKIAVSGRLGGAEIARTECTKEGRVPLHTLRADISYSVAIAKTTYGIIGVKVWIFRGEVLSKRGQSDSNALGAA